MGMGAIDALSPNLSPGTYLLLAVSLILTDTRPSHPQPLGVLATAIHPTAWFLEPRRG